MFGVVFYSFLFFCVLHNRFWLEYFMHDVHVRFHILCFYLICHAHKVVFSLHCILNVGNKQEHRLQD
jgi:hypothetical protein